jgi:hypothetical protein
MQEAGLIELPPSLRRNNNKAKKPLRAPLFDQTAHTGEEAIAILKMQDREAAIARILGLGQKAENMTSSQARPQALPRDKSRPIRSTSTGVRIAGTLSLLQ